MTEAQYKLAKDQEREKAVKVDKKRIDESLSSNNETKLKAIHMEIDGKYGAYILDWGKGMYSYDMDLGFNYEWLSKESLIHNLTLMKSKLEGYALGLENPNQRSYSPSNSVNVNVNNTNEINITVSFEQARQQIEDMTSLTDQETEEIKAKLDELEEIINSKDKKKTKWEKAKSILIWLADKSLDVGMTLLPLLLKIQN